MPNILLILTDQQSATMMSCAGNRHFQTPSMDSIAQRGQRFEKAYCTFPVCLASRFSLMTGRMPSEIGLHPPISISPPVSSKVIRNTIGNLFNHAGYDTYLAGKHHFPNASAEECGFSVLTTDQRNGCASVCAKFLTQRSGKKPFFLVASFINPHDICYMAIRSALPKINSSQDEAYKLVENGKVEISTLDRALEKPPDISEDLFWHKLCPELPINHQPLNDEPSMVKKILSQRQFRSIVRENWTERDWRLHRWAYGRLTEMVDDQIGRVLRALRQSGLEQDTVIIFTSDHGDHDGARKMEHKTFPYEEATRIPLIISFSGETKEGSIDKTNLVSNGLDLLPTLCDYADIDVPNELNGRSLRPLTLAQNDSKWRRDILIESTNSRAIQDSRHKYILYNQGSNREQFFDLRIDPNEMVNLINEPEYIGPVDALRSKLVKSMQV